MKKKTLKIRQRVLVMQKIVQSCCINEKKYSCKNDTYKSHISSNISEEANSVNKIIHKTSVDCLLVTKFCPVYRDVEQKITLMYIWKNYQLS